MMKRKEKARRILSLLKEEYSHTRETVLRFRNPLQLLVATILSAQCTDKKVNEVSKVLFERYKTVEDYMEANIEELQQIIRPTGFYRNKSKFIKGMAKILYEEFDSQIPSSMDHLTRIPGVARKTANIVLSNAFGINEGVAVDTHVMRLSKRLDLTRERDRNKIEIDLMKLFPREEWNVVNNLFVAHGRLVCSSRRPKCNRCVISLLCPSADLEEEKSTEI